MERPRQEEVAGREEDDDVVVKEFFNFEFVFHSFPLFSSDFLFYRAILDNF